MRLRQPQGEGWRGKEGRGVGRWRMGEQKAGRVRRGQARRGSPRPGTGRGREAGLCGRSVRVRKRQGQALWEG